MARWRSGERRDLPPMSVLQDRIGEAVHLVKVGDGGVEDELVKAELPEGCGP